MLEELRAQLVAERAALRDGVGSSVAIEELEIQLARAERVAEIENEAEAERQQVEREREQAARREAARERMAEAQRTASAAQDEAAILFGRLGELEGRHSVAVRDWRRAASEAGVTGLAPAWPVAWSIALRSVQVSLRRLAMPPKPEGHDEQLQAKLRERRARELQRAEERRRQPQGFRGPDMA